jgi:hypothetical protein
MLGSVNSNFVRVCGVNFQVGSFNCHSATARVDVERVEERRASDAAPRAHGFRRPPESAAGTACGVGWAGQVTASICYYSRSRGSHTSRASDSPRLVGSTHSPGSCPAVEVEARTTATPRTRSSERGPRAARAGHRRVVVAMRARRRCTALRRAASAVFENDASAALFSLCRAGRLAPRVPILGCAPHLHRGGGRASYYSLGCRRPPTLAHAPCRGDVASPSRQVASGLRAGCRRDLRACAKKLPHRRAGFYHI